MPITALNSITEKLRATSTAIENVLDGFGVTVADRKRDDLRAGSNDLGQNIYPAYSFDWNAYKKTKSTYRAPSGTPDLYDTGDFHKSITSKRNGYGYKFVLKNAPPYADDLMKKYREPIGISPQAQDILNTELSNQLEKEINKIW